MVEVEVEAELGNIPQVGGGFLSKTTFKLTPTVLNYNSPGVGLIPKKVFIPPHYPTQQHKFNTSVISSL